MGIVKAAAVQLSPVLDEGTIEKVVRRIHELAQQGVQFATFSDTVVPYYPYFSFVQTPLQQIFGTEFLRLLNQSVTVRATLLWQREQWAALPDIRYAGIALTMPDTLWSIFQQNRHLLHDLPALGAAVIQQWVKVKFGAGVLIMVIPHTFGARLNFNSHLHILVSAGGLNDSGGGWTARLYFDRKKLMHMWRFAVITFLREALKAGVLTSDLHPGDLKAVLAREYRWWSTHVDYFQSKEHFLRYAGRYARRP